MPVQSPPNSSSRRRLLVFAVIGAACLAGAVAVAVAAVIGAGNDRRAASQALAAARPRADQVLTGSRPFAVVRTVDRQHPSTYGRLAIATLSGARPGAPIVAGPACGRVAFGAREGICLDVVGTNMQVDLLDRRLRTVRRMELPGIPSRARISPDGRWGGVTAFLVGHAYATPGTFSTAATILDMRTGRVVGDIEKDFKVYDHGHVVDARDRNYWGLTFAADGDTFYATLATSGRTWLIRGSIRARTAHTIYQNVECPSLSPDGTRIAYKQAVGHNPTRWRFHVLDLRTRRTVALAETRSVDDQLYWLDDRHLLYGFGGDVWEVAADGSGRPSVWLAHSDSPTVQRDAGGPVE